MQELSPKEIEDLKSLGFDFQQLEINENATLPELASHMSKQASARCRWSAKAEFALYRVSKFKREYKNWISQKKYKIIISLETSKIRATADRVEKEFIEQYGARVNKFEAKLERLEYEHRLLSESVVRSFDAKASMLQSLRPLIQDPVFKELVGFGKIKTGEKE